MLDARRAKRHGERRGVAKPRLLDLFSGAGGAAMGYHRAGFEVIGVDCNEQPRYPFEFKQADAFEFLEEHGDEFDVIHASPPCQAYTTLRSIHRECDYPDLIERTRNMLIAVDRPYVIENVPAAPLLDPLVLCGTQFNLRVDVGSRELWLFRHRLFESDISLSSPDARCMHRGYKNREAIRVYGGGESGCPAWARRAGMEIDWMNRYELSQAIPPAYTRHIGEQIVRQL